MAASRFSFHDLKQKERHQPQQKAALALLLLLLLDADTSAVYQRDNSGWCPIHVAGSVAVVRARSKARCPDCGTLRGAKLGATFLHVDRRGQREARCGKVCL
jgi:hypothetical protein